MVFSDQLIKFSTRFQRAVHLRYDLRSRDAVDRYIPTVSAVAAMDYILRSMQPSATQRAHVLHAAYGSGKSLLAVCLAALLENGDELYRANERLVDRIQQVSKDTAALARSLLDTSTHYLPVVLSGNEGDFATAVIRALRRALSDSGLDSIQPVTRFEAALQTLERWSTQFPATLDAFELILARDYQYSLDALYTALQAHDVNAFELFVSSYPQVTAGAVFDSFGEQSPELVYRDVVQAVQANGYTGIVVLWDEFGRYLESRTTQVFGAEAALLQNFAEMCNYSGESQIHLLLFTHKELQSYSSNLPKAYQQEWSRIEGRFQRHNITSDLQVAYRLIANAIEHPDPVAIQHLIPDTVLTELINETSTAHLFDGMEIYQVERLIQSTFPLHPLTTFALVRLANKVAQNERTMFTFLTADEPYSLQQLVRNLNPDDIDLFIRPQVLWDYFEDAIRADVGIGGTHHIWSGVAHALDKTADDDASTQDVVKALGVLLICSEQSSVKPTTELLTWAVGSDEARTVLENLRRRKALINRRVDGYWTFASGSDLDFEQKLAEVLERTNPTPLQLRRLLESLVPAPKTLARRYNQEHAVTRYFTGLYRWASELQDAPWNLRMQQLDNTDGLVVYVLAIDDLDIKEAQRNLQDHPRVVFVLPEKPLLHLVDSLRELFALQELSNDGSLKQHEDRTRIQREIDWLMEDARARLEREIDNLIDPRQGKSIWITVRDRVAHCFQGTDASYPTRIVSDICSHVFGATPIFNSEGLNKQKPTTQQVRAAQKVVDALFTNEASSNFGLEGNGPEVLALNSLLVLPGILRRDFETETWIITRPDQNKVLATIWDLIEGFLRQTRDKGPQLLDTLINTLTEPPFGLRKGVLPILLAAVIQQHLRVVTIRRDRRAIFPLTGELITNIIDEPSLYTVETGEWNVIMERLWRAVLSRFGAHLLQNEYHHQPLTLLPMLLIRWLQTQSQFSRQTRRISEEAIRFRDLIRLAQTEPAKVLFDELPRLLGSSDGVTQEEIEERLDSLMTGISNAYLDLQRRLDVFASEEFGNHAKDGYSAMHEWLLQVQLRQGSNLSQMKFGSLVTQELVETVLGAEKADGQFWDRLAKAVTGIYLRDWSDQSETRFYEILTNAHREVEREVSQLVADEAVTAIAIQVSEVEKHEYRFRAADLTAQGKRLLQNFKSTLEIAGRPLSADEKRQIAVAFLLHVMGEDLGN